MQVNCGLQELANEFWRQVTNFLLIFWSNMPRNERDAMLSFGTNTKELGMFPCNLSP